MKRSSKPVASNRIARHTALLLAALCFVCSARADSGIKSWSALQDEINSAASGDTIVLSGDVTAGESDTALIIPDGMKITLDLNGFTLDRNQMTYIGVDGTAIEVASGAVLTVMDSGEGSTGVITGGNSSDGGGIRNSGTLILEGGCVTGNTAETAGGGIVNYGMLAITGGKVTGNTAGKWGGGIRNASRGYMTVDTNTVFGNSAPRDEDIRNTGSMKIVGGDTVDSAAIMEYLDLLSVLPVLVLLLALAFAVHVDKYLDKWQKKVMDVICALVFTLILQNYLDNRLTFVPNAALPRTINDIYGYAVRPAILAMFLNLVQPGRRYRLAWALVVVNAAIYLTALFSPLAFTHTRGFFERGPLGQTGLVVSAILFIYLFSLTVRVFCPHQRRETWIPIILTAIIAASVALDYTVEYDDQPVSFLTIAIAISCVFYYVWLHLQFVRMHEDALVTGQKMQQMLSQIKPHFLHNALTLIIDLCDTAPQKAKKATVEFSMYLRGNMESIDRTGPIPFEKELEHTKLYLDIEQMRFAGDLQVRYDIACTGFTLPALTVEPLAENAVRHGVREKPDGRGTVVIATRETPDSYEIAVTDDGPGFDPTRLPEDGRTHVGIANVRERLRQVVNGTLEYRSAPGEGTTAIIRIPKQ